MQFDLGLNLMSVGGLICILFFFFIEECCKDFICVVCNEVEGGCVVICNICCDVNGDIKDFFKEKEISEDESCVVEENI